MSLAACDAIPENFLPFGLTAGDGEVAASDFDYGDSEYMYADYGDYEQFDYQRFVYDSAPYSIFGYTDPGTWLSMDYDVSFYR